MTGNKNEKLLNAVGEVKEEYILEADPAANRKVINAWTKWAALAACICLVFSGLLMGQSVYRDYMKVTSYISIDVNPSLEFCLNKQNKVVEVCAYNEDGQRVADCLDVKNMSYKKAVQTLLENEVFCSYLKEDSDVTFTVVSDDEEEIMAGIESYAGYCKANQQVHCANYETRHEANQNHCSTGKYVAYQELAEYDENVTLEECKEMTMHELHERIRECEEQHHGLEVQGTGSGNENCDGTGNSSGSGHHGGNHH